MAAEFVAENLHTNIFEMMKNCTGDKEEAVKAGYLKTDAEFLKQVIVYFFFFFGELVNFAFLAIIIHSMSLKLK